MPVASRHRLNALLVIGRGASLLEPAARTVIEIGGQTSKFLLLRPDDEPVDFAPVDYAGHLGGAIIATA